MNARNAPALLALLMSGALLAACATAPAPAPDTSAHQKSEAAKGQQELSSEIDKQRADQR